MAGKIYIGIAGWSYPDWEGVVYPEARTDHLKFVSRFVDCIEINNTFYRPPDERSVSGWLEKTRNRPEFFFTAKLHSDFTHKGVIAGEMVRQFHEGFRPLLAEGKLKQVLAQFRYDFADTEQNRRHLSEIVNSFSDTFHITVEVRHNSWQKPDALQFLKQLGVSVCNLDYPVGRDSFDMSNYITGKAGYFRLHGRNAEKWFSKEASRDEKYDYYYEGAELAEINKRINEIGQACEYLVVIANNHYRGAELANALELKALITGRPVEVPEGLLQAYPGLTKIASNKPFGFFP